MFRMPVEAHLKPNFGIQTLRYITCMQKQLFQHRNECEDVRGTSQGLRKVPVRTMNRLVLVFEAKAFCTDR